MMRLDELMEAQIARFVAELGGGDATQACVQRVGERMLGPYHVDRVKEVLGCLIPKDLHPRYDDKKPRGKAGTRFGQSGVFLKAGPWKVDVTEEQELMDSRVTKATLEFFLIVLRHLCDKLQLPVVVGSHKLGLFCRCGGRRV